MASKFSAGRSATPLRAPALVAGQSLIASVFQHSPMGVVEVSPSLNVLYANARVCRILESADIMGKNLSNFCDSDGLKVIQQKMQSRAEGKTEEYRLTMTTAKGKRIPVAVIAMPVKDSRGSFTGVISFVQSLEVQESLAAIDVTMGNFRTAKEILNGVAAQIRSIIPFDLFNAIVYNDDLTQARVLASYPEGNRWAKKWYDITQGQRDILKVSTTVRENVSSLLNRVGASDRAAVEDFLRQGFKTLIRYPVTREGKIVAAVTLFSKREDAFTDSEIIHLPIPLGKALLTALYFEERSDLTFRLSLITSLANCGSNKQLSERIVNAISQHYGWASVSLFRLDNQAREFFQEAQMATEPGFEIKSGFRQSFDDGILGKCLHQRADVHVHNIEECSDYRRGMFTDARYAQRLKSELCLRIVVDDRVWGILNIEDVYQNAFSSKDQQDLRSLLNEVSSLIARRRTDNLMNALFDRSPYALLVVGHNGRIRKANRAAHVLLELPDGTPNGATIGDYCKDKDIALRIEHAREPKASEITLVSSKRREIAVTLESSDLGDDVGGKLLVFKSLMIEDYERRIKDLRALFYEISAQAKTPLSLAFKWVKDARKSIAAKASRRGIPKVFESGKGLEDTAMTLEHVLQQLIKLDTTINKLELYHDPLSAGFNPVLVDLLSLVDSIRHEFPPSENQWIHLRSLGDSFQIMGDIYQLTFIFRTLLSYFLRLRAGDHTVSIQLGATSQGIEVILCGLLHGKNIEKQNQLYEDAHLLAIKSEIQVGHSIINSFVGNHEGARYSGIHHGDKEMRCTMSFVAYQTKPLAGAPTQANAAAGSRE